MADLSLLRILIEQSFDKDIKVVSAAYKNIQDHCSDEIVNELYSKVGAAMEANNILLCLTFNDHLLNEIARALFLYKKREPYMKYSFSPN